MMHKALVALLYKTVSGGRNQLDDVDQSEFVPSAGTKALRSEVTRSGQRSRAPVGWKPVL